MWSRDHTTFLALVIAVALAEAGCSRSDTAATRSGHEVPGQGTAASPDSKSTTDTWTDQWRKKALADKDPAAFRAAFSQAAHKQLTQRGADPSDVMDKANALDRDPEKIFAFLRDSIGLEPYAGVLRGARGTLMGGSGNALDRALLAQALLKACDIDARLVTGALSEEQANTLLSRFLGNGTPPVLAELVKVPDDAALSAEAADLSAGSGLPEERVQELLQHVRAQNQTFWSRTDARRSAQLEFLTNGLQMGRIQRKVERPALTTILLSRLREHYWLELKGPDGAWTAFDPSFSDAKRGTTYGSARVLLSEIPQEKYHRLEFSLVYRTVTNGTPTTEILMTDTLHSADALFAPLVFAIGPADPGVGVSALAGMNATQFAEALKAMTRFLPVLSAGQAVTMGRAFDLDGHTFDPEDAPSANTGGTFFGDALGGGEAESPPQFLELQVVLRVTGPGRAARGQTRTLVRAEDLMAATFAPPILKWEMLLQPQWLSAEFVGFNALRQAAAVSDALASAQSGGGTSTALAQILAVPVRLMDLALLRESAAAGILAGNQGVRAFIDEPMLTILGHRPSELSVADGRIGREMHLDIVENSIRYVPREDKAESAAFEAALRQGVADCVLEDQYLRELAPDADNRSGTAILEQAQANARLPILASARDTVKLSASNLPEPDVAWIHENEAPASVLLIATTPTGSGAWWSIRPDGNAVLRARGGEGMATSGLSPHAIARGTGVAVLPVQAMPEAAVTKKSTSGATALTIFEVVSTLVCIVEIGELALEGYEGSVSTHTTINVAVCALGQGAAAALAKLHAHVGSWALIGFEVGWHSGQHTGGGHQSSSGSSSTH
jgi:hypothetical protein